MFFRCRDMRCDGKGKLDFQTNKFLITFEHNISYDEHSY